jgi:hypothetical protein
MADAPIVFVNCANLSLGNNKIVIFETSRSDIPGVAAFQIAGHTTVTDLGDNQVLRGLAADQSGFGVYSAPYGIGDPSVLFGSLTINGISIDLAGASGLFHRLW